MDIDKIDDAVFEVMVGLDEAFDIGLDLDDSELMLIVRDSILEKLEEVRKDQSNDMFLNNVGEMFDIYYPVILENGETVIELETQTDNGVIMGLYLEEESNMSWLDQLKDYVRKFDTDENIDLLRSDKKYSSFYTVYETIEDVGTYIEDVDNWIVRHEEELNYTKEKVGGSVAKDRRQEKETEMDM